MRHNEKIQVLRMDLDALRKAGFKVSNTKDVTSRYGQFGGGREIIITTKRIHPKYLTRVK